MHPGPRLDASGPLDWSIVSGWVPVVLSLLALASLGYLLFSRDRRWWLRLLPIVLGAAALVTVAANVFVVDVWKPFTDDLPVEVILWTGLVVFALIAGGVQFYRRKGWRARALAVVAIVVVGVFGINQINRVYDEYPTLRNALDSFLVKYTPLDQLTGDRTLVIAPAGKYLSDVWKPPANMPATGTLTSANIPPTKSGFSARTAWIYLPPAYQANPRPRLPVLLLMAGQPGSPRDWVDSGNVVSMMDSFAQQHHGLAPVVVMADDTGSEFGNTLCMDSNLGKTQTYLAVDVPNWVKSTFQVDPDATQWVAAGLSFGGTCSLQLAVNAPEAYGDFISISGQDEPTLGTYQESVDKAFNGEAAAFQAVNPLTVLSEKKFPDTRAVIVAGAEDEEYKPQQRKVYNAGKAAGMKVIYMELPGAHGWQVWRPGLSHNLVWIARTTMLSPI